MAAGSVFTMIIILVISGFLVHFEDIVTVLLSSLYIYLMSKYFFPPVTPTAPPAVYPANKLLRRYVTGAAFVGLYFPIAYIVLGVLLGHTKAVQTAAPPTFLLAAQVLSERFTSYSKALSLPARALVPILYNSLRLVSIWEWFENDFRKEAAEGSTNSPSNWLYVGRILAVANVVLWSYNLFCFLLPMYLPLCFRKYFEDEKVWKEQGVESHKDCREQRTGRQQN